MATRDDIALEITPEVLLKAYACGIFPMAEAADDPALYWIEPERRGILPLGHLHIPTRLQRTIRQGIFEVRIDSDFDSVIGGCGGVRPNRQTTWINDKIRSLCKTLFGMGYCHTVETWHDGRLVGGLYGVALGGAFFGESMFHEVTDASKVALHALVMRLRARGFELLDTQWLTPHLETLGALEIPRAEYRERLLACADKPCRFAD